ncbi:MAG: dipeptide epimerase [Desulfobacterales bacterium]|jgi:L-alanine-DL-glutamate epimerase-like enolase superfamily enzyme
MKIKKVSTWKENLELTRPYTIAYERVEAVENLFVLIEAENGLVGIGAGSPEEFVTGESFQTCEEALGQGLEPILAGADIRNYKTLLRRLAADMPAAPAALAAADMALHDLWAQSLDLPLVDVLGRIHDALPTSKTIGIKSVGETLAEAEEYRQQGFGIIKVKIGRDVDEDIERLVRLRERYGPEVALRVDANQGYSLTQYMQFYEQTKRLDLEFVEQPLAAADLDSMRSLPKDVRERTAADECLLSPSSALACLCAPLPFGIFNIKLMKCGGIAPGLEIATMAQYAGIDLMWGCMDESIVSISAALHAALASPATRYLDLDGSLDLARDVVQGGFVLENGWLRTTVRPGLGVSRI